MESWLSPHTVLKLVKIFVTFGISTDVLHEGSLSNLTGDFNLAAQQLCTATKENHLARLEFYHSLAQTTEQIVNKFLCLLLDQCDNFRSCILILTAQNVVDLIFL